jgi:ribosomal protein L12E/L44/L45/RPP1/RPP2
MEDFNIFDDPAESGKIIQRAKSQYLPEKEISEYGGFKPVKFNQGIVNVFIESYADSTKSLDKICSELGIQAKTIRYWRRTNEEFKKVMVECEKDRADMLVDEALENIDESIEDNSESGYSVARATHNKSRAEFKLKVAERLHNEKWGKKTEVKHEINAEDVGSLNEDQFARLVDAVLNKPDGEIQEAEEIPFTNSELTEDEIETD